MEDELPFDKPKTAPPADVNPETGEIIEPKKKDVSANQIASEAVKSVTKVPDNRPKANPFQTLLLAKKKTIENFMGNTENAMKFMSAVNYCIEKVPDLMACSAESVIAAFMECAALRLYPGNANGDAYVLPYKGKAQFQLGYKGVKTLAYRSGILRLVMETVYENDKYEEVLGTNPQIIHKKTAFGKDRGKPIGAYAAAEVTPGKWVHRSLSEADIMKIKSLSPSKNSPYSPWNANDPFKSMWGKSAVKQLAKIMPTSDEMKRAVYLDNVSERGGFFENDGNVIEAEFEEVLSEDEAIASGNDRKAALRNKKSK